MADAPPTGWRILPLRVAPAAEQLALTEALWQDVAARRHGATIRWYSYGGPALVLGVGQRETDIMGSAARRDRLPIVTRSSGGAAVLAARDMLALDVALPSPPGAVFGDVVESYRWLGEAFLEALRALAPIAASRLAVVDPPQARADQASQRAALPGTPESLRARACFGTLSPYEVALVDPGFPPRKLVGLSQVRKRGVVLYQAGLYHRFSGDALAPYLAGDSASLARELDRHVAALDAVGLDDEAAVVDAVTRAIAAAAPAIAG
jgi:lipoate-protein ligase A